MAKAYRIEVMACTGTICAGNGSFQLIEELRKEIKKQGLESEIEIVPAGCNGLCGLAPILLIKPDNIFYKQMNVADIPYLVAEHFLKGRPVKKFMYVPPREREPIPLLNEIDFFRKQVLVALRNRGLIDPEVIEEYIARDGYAALAKVLTAMKPEEVIEEIKLSGLRGRGGAGFPTGLKWEAVRKANGSIKYLICNGDEGDPGAFMDRSIIESDPHSVIEGMLIGAYAMGAKEGFIYIRNEYPLAVKRINIAIEQAREKGLLGEKILGFDFNFDLKTVKGAGAFVCGEETALIASVEGRIGEPRPRPPYPAEKGLWGMPTCINNVETWATIPVIINRGAKWFASMGTETSKGTKVFSLVGKINNTGLIEVPMGITLKEIIYDIGGGIASNRKFKAVQTGGPSGGCIPASLLNLPIDYESLTSAGSIMGSGGMVIMDDSTCMVDIARYFLNFTSYESCGKCTPCREGLAEMLRILNKITEGKGSLSDLKTLESLSEAIKDGSLCGLGKTAPNPVLSTLRYFRNEYEDHILRMRCQAAVCKEIISSPCHHSCPIGQEASTYIALIAKGRLEEALKVIKKDNPLANTLARVCNHPCEYNCRAGKGGDPISIRGLKRYVTDYGLEKGLLAKVREVPKNGKGKIAVVGSGPAGLTAAFYLAQKGYDVSIFEKHNVLGGMLAIGIPEFRLPRKVLKADIDYILSAGIKVKTNTALGKDFTIDDLFKEGFKAVFLGIGAHKSLRLNIPGEDAAGVMAGMEVLEAINLKKEIRIGKRVGIIGGGNCAVDVARAVMHTGIADNVTIYYRRTIAEMPAFKEEIEDALEEGIKISFLTLPKRIITAGGKLKACEFIKMGLGEVDESGRRRPVAIPGSEYIEELDTLIVAIGEVPDSEFAAKAGLQTTSNGTLITDPETLATNRLGVFAGGDLVTGPNTVVEAMAQGKIAADSIDKFMKGIPIKRDYKLTRPSLYVEPIELTEADLAENKRQVMPRLEPNKRKGNFNEIALGFTKIQASKECKRCLRCDLETADAQAFLEKLREKAV